MKAAETLPSFAIHWARELGENANSLERLQGGINNRVFRCGCGSQKFVIKGYAPAQPGKMDRMQVERQFLEFAVQVAPGFTPRILHSDPYHRCIIIENIAGKPVRKGTPPPDEAVRAAVRFIQLLNSDATLAREAIGVGAAEGFLSFSEHMANIRSRLEKMSYEHVISKRRKEAKMLIKEIRAEAIRVEETVKKAVCQGSVVDAIRPIDRCVSPGDFGFHNAILTAAGVRFIDFEFAGWDDPAKTNLDFILQPSIPIQSQELPLLSAWKPKRRREIQMRCHYLAPILKIKWLCIILGVLNPTRAEQILRTLPEEEGFSLVSRQLEVAISYMSRLKIGQYK